MLSALYALCALLLALYTLGQGILLLQYWRHRSDETITPPLTEYPPVTVQCPIYNEQHVAQRLIDALAQLDYPADKLCIQLLDDSTDHTSALIARQIQQYPHLNIRHIRREKRDEYKAGALAHGLAHTDSPFVAIFDADFIPPPDFLQRTLPHLLADERIGVVQTRWGHLNGDANWLTRAQVLSVDVHFIVEQTGRYRAGWVLPFNGTGGVWRTACIHDAEGWSGETLTEDLDLSYRAQMRGWRSVCLPDVVVPGELPPQLAAYRQQQSRWATGSAQCLRKLLGSVWRAPLSWSQRLMATQHLLQYLPHPLMLMLLLLTPPLLWLQGLQALPLAPLGIIGLIPPLMYLVSQRDAYDDGLPHLLAFPVLLLVGTGMIWQNTRAFIAGLWQRGGTFKRTPKFVHEWQHSHYAQEIASVPTPLIETALAFYALWSAWLAWQMNPALVPYLLLYAASFGTVAAWDTLDRWRVRQSAAQRSAFTEPRNDSP